MFQRWPKRDPNKHYYLVPNEVFNLGLSSHEIAVYNYLLRCEDRRTYQCHPSYRTIGRAVQLSENTVRKYVAGLEEKGLIRTEPSTIKTKDGRVRNGSLIYTIRPVQEALELNYQRQFLQAERDMERAKAEKRQGFLLLLFRRRQIGLIFSHPARSSIHGASPPSGQNTLQ